MRPTDLYALPTLSEEAWTRSPSVAVMFGDEVDPPHGTDATRLPLRVLTKVQADHLEDGAPSVVAWQVVTWCGEPLGVVVRGEDTLLRVVTDAALHKEAYLGLLGLRTLDLGDDAAPPDEDVRRLDVAGGQMVTLEGGRARATPTRLCGGRASLVDVDLLAARMGEFDGLGAESRVSSVGEEALGECVLAAAGIGLRRTLDYDAKTVLDAFASLRKGWLGPVVATPESTYLLCVGRNDMLGPVTDVLEARRLGPASFLDVLARGRVFEPGEEPEDAQPRP